MGFHKRWITDEGILAAYTREGVSAVWDMFTRGANALLISGKLGNECLRMINAGDRSGLSIYLAANVDK